MTPKHGRNMVVQSSITSTLWKDTIKKVNYYTMKVRSTFRGATQISKYLEPHLSKDGQEFISLLFPPNLKSLIPMKNFCSWEAIISKNFYSTSSPSLTFGTVKYYSHKLRKCNFFWRAKIWVARKYLHLLPK